MPSPTEVQRIAAAMNAVRPTWRADSLVSFLTKHHAARPYGDLLIAGIVVALDPKTETPALLNRHGRWWTAAQAVFAAEATPTIGPGRERCTIYGHEHYPAHNCPGCRTDELTALPPLPTDYTDAATRAAGKD